jgi:antitoxin MazE
MKAIPVSLRAIGNSRGLVIPKSVLAQLGLTDSHAVELTVERGAIVLRKAAAPARSGWADAARQLAANHGDSLLLGEFPNDSDSDLTW